MTTLYHWPVLMGEIQGLGVVIIGEGKLGGYVRLEITEFLLVEVYLQGDFTIEAGIVS